MQCIWGSRTQHGREMNNYTDTSCCIKIVHLETKKKHKLNFLWNLIKNRFESKPCVEALFQAFSSFLLKNAL